MMAGKEQTDSLDTSKHMTRNANQQAGQSSAMMLKSADQVPRKQINTEANVEIDSKRLEMLEALSFREYLKTQGMDMITTENNAKPYVTSSSKTKKEIKETIDSFCHSLFKEEVVFTEPVCCKLLKNDDGTDNNVVLSYFKSQLKSKMVNAHVVVDDSEHVFVCARNESDAKKASAEVTGCIHVHIFAKEPKGDLSKVIATSTKTQQKMKQVPSNDETVKIICLADVCESLLSVCVTKQIHLGTAGSLFFSTFGKKMISKQEKMNNVKADVENKQLILKGTRENIGKFQKLLKEQYTVETLRVQIPPLLMNKKHSDMTKIAENAQCCWETKYNQKQKGLKLEKCKYIATWFHPSSTGKVTLICGNISDLCADEQILLINDSQNLCLRLKVKQSEVVSISYKTVDTSALMLKDQLKIVFKDIFLNMKETPKQKITSVAIPLSAMECIAVNDIAEAIIFAVSQTKPDFEVSLCFTEEDFHADKMVEILDRIEQENGNGTSYRKCNSDEVNFSSGRNIIDVQVVNTSLTDLKVDVIVNTVDTNLDLKNGHLSSHILHEAGEVIQDECIRLHPKGIVEGDIAVTSSGNLLQKGIKKIFHCALPRLTITTCKEDIENIVRKCLQHVEKYKLKSIAFPAIGTGKLQYPLRDVAYAIFNVLKHYQKYAFKIQLKTVMFSISDETSELYKVFETEKRRFAEMYTYDDTNLIVPSVIGIINGKTSTMKLNIIQEAEFAYLPSYLVDVHFVYKKGQEVSLKFSSHLPETAHDQLLFFTTDENPDNLEQLASLTNECITYCNKKRIATVCLHTIDNTNMTTIDQIQKIAESVLRILNGNKNFLQEIYIAVDNPQQLDSIKGKLLETPSPGLFTSFIKALQNFSSDNKSKVVWQESSAEDVPVDLVIVGSTANVDTCKQLMQQCLYEAKAMYKMQQTKLKLSATASDQNDQDQNIQEIHHEGNAVMSQEAITQKAEVTAVINHGIISHFSRNEEIDNWISKMQSVFHVGVFSDQLSQRYLVMGSFEDILHFEDYLDNVFPNYPDKCSINQTDQTSKNVNQSNAAESAATAEKIPTNRQKEQQLEDAIEDEIPKHSGSSIQKSNDVLTNKKDVGRMYKDGNSSKKAQPKQELQVCAKNEDITSCSEDCLIVSCDEMFSTSYGIMKLIEKNAGIDFQNGCREQFKKGKLGTSECRHIKAQLFKCKNIIFVNGQITRQTSKVKSLSQLQDTYRNALRKADELQFKSVAVHAILGDSGCITIKDCVHEFLFVVDTVRSQLQNLLCIHFYEKNKKTFATLMKLFVDAGYRDSKESVDIFYSVKLFNCCVKIASREPLQVDALVSWENEKIDGSGKIASFLLCCGNHVYKQAHGQLKRENYKTTDVLYTKVTTEKFKCKYVLHAIVQDRKSCENKSLFNQDIQETMYNILRVAAELKCKSVSLQLNGFIEHVGMPPQSCCTALVAGMISYFKSAQKCEITDMIYWMTDMETAKMFYDTLDSNVSQRENSTV